MAPGQLLVGGDDGRDLGVERVDVAGDLFEALAALALEQRGGEVLAPVLECGAIADQAVAGIDEFGQLVLLRASLRDVSDPKVQALLVQAIRVLNGLDRILIFGIGPSAALSEYVSLLLRRHGRNARSINATGNGLADQLLDLKPADGLLVLSYGRTYAEVELLFEEAERLNLPVVLVTDSLEPKLARKADVIVPARRGRQGRVAMHGVTLIVLEAIALGLALADREKAMDALARVGDLRHRLANIA